MNANKILSSLFASACVLCGCQSSVIKESNELRQLFADAWEYRLADNPLFATRVGDHRGNDKLPSRTIASAERRATAYRKFIVRLERIDRDQLAPGGRTNYDIFKRTLEESLAEHEFHSYLMPITNRSGFHIFFPGLPKQVPLESVRDYENYTARLRGFKVYVDQYIERMRKGIETGYVLPRVVLDGFEGSITPHIVEDPTKSLLYVPFDNFPGVINENDRRRLQSAAREAIATSVVVGYRNLLEFMRAEYVPGARATIAASDLPNGKAFYEHRVRLFTTLDITPAEVHAIGQSEVVRIKEEMLRVIRDAKFTGDFGQFLEFLRTDEQFYVDEATDLLKEAAYILKRMDGKLPQLFGNIPRIPYGLEEIPAYIAPKTTTAYYSRPSGDGTKAGIYSLNTYDLKSRPIYELESLSLHEAVPGHHLQIALQQELEGLPEFRRFTGFTAFVEGWALYAERLGLEVGFYDDHYSNFGRLTYEMWRACRLVVDTGIHSMGWTRQQAINFMADNTALTLHNITTEVDRYIAWPAQALAYKMGELKIRGLREKAETSLGKRFDIRKFHDVVLGSGSVPLPVLEANINAYIRQVMAHPEIDS